MYAGGAHGLENTSDEAKKMRTHGGTMQGDFDVVIEVAGSKARLMCAATWSHNMAAPFLLGITIQTAASARSS